MNKNQLKNRMKKIIENDYEVGIDMTFYQYWEKINKMQGHMDALEYFGNKWTFSETQEMFNDYAKSLKELKLKEGQSVTICAPLVPSTIATIYAANKIGVQINLVSPELLALNAVKYLDETETNTLLILDRFYPSVAEQIATTKVANVVVASLSDDAPDFIKPKLNAGDFFELNKELPENINYISKDEFVKLGKYSFANTDSVYDSEATAVVLYTGGSTGVPKGVELYNSCINRMSQVYKELELDYVPGDRNMLLIPPNHPTSLIHGLIAPWSCLDGGITQVCQPIYNRHTFAHDIISNNIQSAVAAPSHYATLPNSNLAPGSLKNFKNPFCGGEAVPYELAASINRALKIGEARTDLIYAYGMSEFGPLAIVSPNDKGLNNKVGKPLPGVIARIIDDNGKILDDNQRGNLEIKAECAMKGYFKNPGLTKAFYTKDGFAKTGDIAIRDENGNYTVQGRATDSFIANNGEKIYLFDIENFIYSAKPNEILEAEAVGLSIEGTTEKIPVVHIVLTDECAGKEAELIKEIDEKCKANLGHYEIPKGYKVRTAFGTNPISTKRDYKSLTEERAEYYRSKGDKLYEVAFISNGDEKINQLRDYNDIKIHDQVAGVAKIREKTPIKNDTNKNQ